MYLPDTGLSRIEGLPPRSRDHREPIGPDTPRARATPSLVGHSAIVDIEDQGGVSQ